MIKRLYVDNFKCLVNFDLALSDLTLLLGANGSGKSSVLDVIYALRQLVSGVAKVTDPEIFPNATLTRWQSRTAQVIELGVELDDDVLEYRLEIEHDLQGRRAVIRHESLRGGAETLFAFVGGEVQLYRDDGSAGPTYGSDWTESALARVTPRPDNKRLTRFLEYLRRILVCGLYPRGFGAESHTEDALLDRDGGNFVAWYRHNAQERLDLVADFTLAMRDVLAGFQSLRLKQVGEDARVLMVQLAHDGTGRHELRFDELSDGQRALLALYALLHITRGQGHTLFLDEPDNYISLPEIEPWLAELREACGDGIPQAVLCSHHPEAIDQLGAENGILLQRKGSGVVTTGRLDATACQGGLKLSELLARGWEG